MSKTKTMWLSREMVADSKYILWNKEPKRISIHWMAPINSYQDSFQSRWFSGLFPSLKLRPGQCIQVRVTNTPNGVSIRRMK